MKYHKNNWHNIFYVFTQILWEIKNPSQWSRWAWKTPSSKWRFRPRESKGLLKRLRSSQKNTKNKPNRRWGRTTKKARSFTWLRRLRSAPNVLMTPFSPELPKNSHKNVTDVRSNQIDAKQWENDPDFQSDDSGSLPADEPNGHS